MEWILANRVWQGLLNLIRTCRLTPRKVSFLELVVKQYESYFKRLSKRFGDKVCFSILKETERRVQNLYVYGVPDRKPSYDSFPVWQKTDKRGIPLRLCRLSRLSMYNRRWARSFSLLVAGRYRAVEGFKIGWKFPKAELTTSSFTFDFKAFDRALTRLTRFFNLKRFKVRGSELLDKSVWIGTASPVNKVSADGACVDALLLLKDRNVLGTIRRFYEALEPQCTRLPPEGFAGWYRWLQRLKNAAVIKPFKSNRPAALARFIWVPDRGGKLRGVTPLNYHIQSFLLPIHRYFMAILRAIRTDCTFTETLGLEFVRKCTLKGVEGSSFDLPSATTQFPIEIMVRVVKHFLGSEASEAWFRLMRIPMYFQGIGFRPLARGAPMGFYAMWPVFTLAHHAIVQMAYEKVCLRSHMPVRIFNSYRIRGDDNYVASRDVSQELDRIWTSLNQRPDPVKSFRSEETGPGIGSFAKRTFIRGMCLQSFTFAELRAAQKYDPLMLIDLYPRVCEVFGQSGILKPGYIANRFLEPLKSQGFKALGEKRVSFSISCSSSGSVLPDYWLPFVSFSLATDVDKVRFVDTMVNTSIKLQLATRAGKLAYETFGEWIAEFLPEGYEMIQKVDVFGPKSRLSKSIRSDCTDVITELPLYLAMRKLLDRVSDLRDFISGGTSSYQESLFIRALREMEGFTEVLRSQTRKSGRLQILSARGRVKRNLLKSFQPFEGEFDFKDAVIIEGGYGVSMSLFSALHPPSDTTSDSSGVKYVPDE